MMKRCAKYAKIFLVAMVNEQQRTTMVETSFEKVGVSSLFATNIHLSAPQESKKKIDLKVKLAKTILHQVIMWLSAFRTIFLVYSTIIYVPDHCHVFGLCWEQVVDACIRLCATHGVPCPTADALLATGYVCEIGFSVIWA